MSYNGSGTFNINTTGQPVVAGTVITASAFNALTADLATGLTTAITKDGQTTTTARITFAQGLTSSLTTDSSSTSTGSIITAGGAGIAKNVYVGGNANVAGTLDVTGGITTTNPVINNIKMGYSTTATAGGSTSLTVSSNYRQFFTGTLAQTIVLPVTSTLVTGIAYEIENNSTGTLTVNSSGGNLVGTVPAGVCAHAVCIGTTLTTAADWDWDYISTSTITGTGANVLGTSPTITSPTLVTPALGTPASGVMTNVTGINYDGFKNRIINGGFGIWQRGTSSSAAGYLADRWQLENAGTYSQSTDVPSGQGFPYSCTVSVTTGTSYGVIKQKIEAANCTDLVGQNATLTFWVKNLTGSTSMTAILYNANSADNFGAVTSISSQSFTAVLNTWTKFTFNYTSLPSGAANGLQVYVFSADASVAPSYRFTGCQLEKGSTATSFDSREYGEELRKCQRYFETSMSVAPADSMSVAQTGVFANASSSATPLVTVSFKVTKRADPTVTYYAPLTTSPSGKVREDATGTIRNVTGGSATNWGAIIGITSGATNVAYQFGYQASAEL